jgi:creatinine amidohydrolase
MTAALAEMTWREVADAVADGATTVILPLGATEQHGPHLPLGTDTFRAQALAERLGAELPDALVAPTLPLGCSDEHHGFAGLMSLGHRTLADVIVDCARSMAGWGLRRLVLLSAHGGNGEALELAVARLAEELPALAVVVLGSSTRVPDVLQALAARDGVPTAAVGLHAGEGETSEMLALRPDLVRMERAEPGFSGGGEGLMLRLREQGLRAITPTGVLGDGRLADAGRGARYVGAQIDGFRRALCGAAASPAARRS